MSPIPLLSIFDEKQVHLMKDGFLGEFEAKCVESRRRCAETGLVDRLDQDHRDVLRLLQMCGNAYHVEALRRLVLRDQMVPKWNHVEELANRLMTEALT